MKACVHILNQTHVLGYQARLHKGRQGPSDRVLLYENLRANGNINGFLEAILRPGKLVGKGLLHGLLLLHGGEISEVLG